jgi:hypothetical protein
LASTTKPVAWLDMFHSVSKARVRSTWIVTTPLATFSSVRVQRESSASETGTLAAVAAGVSGSGGLTGGATATGASVAA